MLTCKETSYLASKKLDQKLTLREKLGFFLHTSMCRLCRKYTKDINRLHLFMLKTGKKGQSILPESIKLSGQSRERIKQVLDKAFKDQK